MKSHDRPADDLIEDGRRDAAMGNVRIALMLGKSLKQGNDLVVLGFIETGLQAEFIFRAADQAVPGNVLAVFDPVFHTGS